MTDEPNQLWLLRHGSAGWGDGSLSDKMRVLNDTGEAQSRRMGSIMRDRGLLPEHVYCSDAQRTLDTLTGLLEHLSMAEDILTTESDLYLANPQTLLDFARDGLRQYQRVLFIAHNPGLEELTTYLTGRIVPMAPCTLVCIALQDLELKQHNGHLLDVIQG